LVCDADDDEREGEGEDDEVFDADTVDAFRWVSAVLHAARLSANVAAMDRPLVISSMLPEDYWEPHRRTMLVSPNAT
jgi:hypothetical protein